MKNIHWKYIAFTLALIVLPFAATVLMAQPPPPPPPAPAPSAIPLDGGISLLLAGLGAYGIKKYFVKTN